MASAYSIEGLEDRLNKHANKFDRLLSTIPVKLYLPEGGSAGGEEARSKYHFQKRGADKKEKAKAAKRAKLDPENQKSVVEVQAERAEMKKIASEIGKGNGGSDDTASELSLDLSGRPLPAFGGEDEDMEEGAAPRAMTAASPTELKSLLRARIAHLRDNRKGTTRTEKERKAILEKRKARKESRKEDARIAREKSAAGRTRQENIIEDELAEDRKAAAGGKRGEKNADTIREDGELAFGKLLLDGEKKKGKNTQAVHALRKIEEKKEKTEALKAKNPEKAAEVVEKEQWRKVMALAEGEKPKDDATLLKKAIKRVEVEKRKSAKEWVDRKATVGMALKKKVDRREKNLKSRIDEKKARRLNGGKKVKVPAKKKQARPGFEGKPKGGPSGKEKGKGGDKGRK